MNTVIVSALSLLFALGSHAAEPEKPQEQARMTFPAKGLKSIDVLTETGAIEVQGADVPEVCVEVIDRGEAKKCAIITRVDGDTLVLKAESPHRWIKLGSCPTGFKVKAPAKLALQSSSGTGDMAIAAVDGAITIYDGTGKISPKKIGGDLTARLGSGGIEGSARSKKLDIMMGSGPVKIDGLSGSADVKSGSGEVRLSWAKAPAQGDVSIKSGSGDVTLFFPEATKLRAHVLSGSGKTLNEIGESEKAGLSISVISGSGDVSIRKPSAEKK